MTAILRLAEHTSSTSSVGYICGAVMLLSLHFLSLISYFGLQFRIRLKSSYIQLQVHDHTPSLAEHTSNMYSAACLYRAARALSLSSLLPGSSFDTEQNHYVCASHIQFQLHGSMH